MLEGCFSCSEQPRLLQQVNDELGQLHREIQVEILAAAGDFEQTFPRPEVLALVQGKAEILHQRLLLADLSVEKTRLDLQFERELFMSQVAARGQQAHPEREHGEVLIAA